MWYTPVNDNIAVTEHGIDIALSVLLVRAEIAAVVRADGTLRLPVVLRVDEHGVIKRGAEIEHRLEHVVLDLYELHCLIDARLVPPGKNGDNVARKADMAVDHEPVEPGSAPVRSARPAYSAGRSAARPST